LLTVTSIKVNGKMMNVMVRANHKKLKMMVEVFVIIKVNGRITKRMGKE